MCSDYKMINSYCCKCTATVGFTEVSRSFSESIGSVTFTASLSNPSSTDIIVQVRDTQITATRGGVDYDSGPYTVTFTAGQTSASFNVPINDDNIFEANETFSLTIDPSSLPNRVTLSSSATLTATISDDDSPTVSFSTAIYRVGEDDGAVQLQLVLSNPSSTDITVQVSDTAVNATRGVDYTAGPYAVMFPAGQMSALFDITINDDNILERSETFTIDVDSSSLPTGVSVSSTSQATVAIDNDDSITVRFDQSTYSVNEDAGPSQLVLVLSNIASFPITVQVVSTDRTATGGDDYNSGPYTVTFPAEVTSMSFNVPIRDEMICEGNETFTLTIDSSLLPNNVGVADPGNTTVSIVDNEVCTVSFEQSAYSYDENNGPAQPVLVLSNPSSTDITVQVLSTDGTAIGGDDYNSGPYMVTFTAGQTSVSFNVGIINDNTLEANEDFTLTIDSSSILNNFRVGDPGSATVTIVNDDAITVTFSQSTYSFNEDAGPAQPVLVLSNPSSTDITVQEEVLIMILDHTLSQFLLET
ncbi:extracellular matrix organizing protein FRAS1-like [Dysidea avara]|uniref:extracellular matrix organizing protein FRAS1-like n=1 Tax=Dysidea avara TaxID=196820 RepID=UPI00332432FB